MLKRLIFGIALSVCVAACAHTPAPAQANAGSSPPAGCVYPGTATRLPQKDPSGCAAFGGSWSHEDLKRTGALDPGQALQLLDPRVTASH